MTIKLLLVLMQRKNTKDIVLPGAWRWCAVLQYQLFCQYKTNTQLIQSTNWVVVTFTKIPINASGRMHNIGVS